MCATGLRHAPTVEHRFSQKCAGASRTQARPERLEPVADAPERLRVRRLLHAELELLGRLARVRVEPLLGAFEREPLLVQEGLDPLDQIEVAPPIEPLAGRVLLRAQQLELGLPVPENVRRDRRDRLDLADPVVELLGDVRRRGV